MGFLLYLWIKSSLSTARSLVNEAIPDYSSLCWHFSIYEIPIIYRKRLWDQVYWRCLINNFYWPIILLIVKFGDIFNTSIAQPQFILLRIIGGMILAILHTHLSQKRIFIFFTVSYCFPPCLTLSFPPLSLVWTLADVRLDQPQQRVVPAESHRDRCQLPTRPGPADTAQPLCHEFHGELRALGAAQGGGEGQHRRPPPVLRERGTCERLWKEGQAGWGSSRVLLFPARRWCMITSLT